MYFLLVLLFIVNQASCCRQSFSYPVLADIARIEVTKDNVTVKEIKEASSIDSIVHFIDERRSRWCLPVSNTPSTVGSLNLFKSEGTPSTIGLGRGFFVVEITDREYLLSISANEQQALFKLLEIDEAAFFRDGP